MSYQIRQPFAQFFGLDGKPLEGGKIYIGEANKNPQTDPIQVYSDDALTQPLAQPLRTTGGYVSLNGKPIQVFAADTAMSVACYDSNMAFVFCIAEASGGESLLQFIADLANSSDPAKGASLVGYKGQPLNVFLDKTYRWDTLGIVLDGVTDNSAALAAAVASGVRSIYLGDGDCYIASTFQAPAGGFSLIGNGRTRTSISTDQNITAIQHTTHFKLRGIRVRQKSPHQGIGIGNYPSDASFNQAAYCTYEDFEVTGFNFSFWFRCSIWLRFVDGYSRSRVGIRFARRADPYDVTSNAPAGWNTFSPTLGWFHNVGLVHNVNFEDLEVGVWGCCMGYEFSGVTTQRQNQLSSTNAILPTTEVPTGILLESGVDGVRGNWGNKFTAHYAEACKRPFLIKDQRTCNIDVVFFQGNTEAEKYLTPLEARNSSVTISGATGQDWFLSTHILKDGAVVSGNTAGAVSGNTASVDSTSTLRRNGSIENYVTKYAFATSAATANFVLPPTLADHSAYRLDVIALYDGYAFSSATYDIRRWNSDALTAVTVASGTPSNFSVSVSGGKIRVAKSGSQPMDFRATLTSLSNMASYNTTLLPS